MTIKKTAMIVFLVTLLGLIGYGQKLVKPTVSVKGRTFVATAYCLQGRMANGQKVHSGAVAADPRVLKLGSTILINGKRHVVKDTGGAIKGNRLDIWMGSCKSARQFGRRNVSVLTE